MNRILVTGATGTVGSDVVRLLRQRNLEVRAFVRDRDKAIDMLGADVDLAVGDLGDPESVRAAMDGVDQVFLASANHPMQVAWETTAIDIATETGVRRMVKLSALDAEIGSPVAFADAHGQLEKYLSSQAIDHVILKSGFMMTNLLGAADGVQKASAIFLPGAGAKIAMIDPRDVAEVAVVALTSDGHERRSYVLTGREAVTFDGVAERLSDVTGRPVAFVAVPDEAALGQLIETGVPEWFARNMVEQFRLQRQGTQAEVRDLVRVLTGREPRTVAEFLQDHADAFA